MSLWLGKTRRCGYSAVLKGVLIPQILRHLRELLAAFYDNRKAMFMAMFTYYIILEEASITPKDAWLKKWRTIQSRQQLSEGLSGFFIQSKSVATVYPCVHQSRQLKIIAFFFRLKLEILSFPGMFRTWGN